MTFLHPQAFWFALLLPVIVAAYLFRARWREHSVSSILLWQKTVDRTPHKQFLGKLRHPLSLLLQIILFAFILLALAKPEWKWLVANNIVVVIDARARMQANDGEPFRNALHVAREIAGRAGPANRIAIIVCNGPTRVLCPFTEDSRFALHTLNDLEVSDAGGDIDPALALADSLLGSTHGQNQLIILTDRPMMERSDRERVMAFGKGGENLGITAISSMAPATPALEQQIFLQVENFGSAPREVEVEISRNGTTLQVVRKKIHSPEPWSFSVPAGKSRQTPEFLTAKITAADSLAVDNVAYAIAQARKPLNILLITKGNRFLENALRADTSLTMEILFPEAWNQKMAASFDAVIFDRFLPEDFTLEMINEGNFLFLGRSPFETGEISLDPLVTRSDSNHPITASLSLDALRIFRAANLKLPTMTGWNFRTLVDSEALPLFVAGESKDSAKRKMAASAFSTGDSDIPLRAVFPILLSNTLHWLAQKQPPLQGEGRAGESALLQKGQTMHGPWMKGLIRGNLEIPPMVEGGSPLLKNGYYEIREGDSRQWLAINTISRRESDMLKSQDVKKQENDLPGSNFFPIWQIFILIACVLLPCEWHWHHRRITE